MVATLDVKFRVNNSGLNEVKKACKILNKKLQVGYFSNAFVVEKAYDNEFGSYEKDIPERGFMRHAANFYGKNILEDSATSLGLGEFTLENAKYVVSLLGKNMKNAIQDSIDTVSSWSIYPHNSPTTIEYKGFDRPLYFTGEMRNSIEIREGK